MTNPAPRRSLTVCSLAELGDVATAEDAVVGAIAVFNVEGELFAIADRCTHEKAWLSEGYLEGCAVECPLHASLFDLRTGIPSGPPATVAVATYPVRVEDGLVVVDIDGDITLA